MPLLSVPLQKIKKKYRNAITTLPVNFPFKILYYCPGSPTTARLMLHKQIPPYSIFHNTEQRYILTNRINISKYVNITGKWEI
jgi:hypothetical protein